MNKKKTDEPIEETEPQEEAVTEASETATEEVETPSTAPEPDDAAEEKEEEPLRLQLMRLQADFDNFRKRQTRERAEWILRANEDLFLEILPVLDHYEMGLKSAEEHQTDCSVTEGFKMVYNQLLDVLKKSNVEPIDAVGKPFDPHHHEALTHMPSDEPAETVVQEVRRGYMMGDKLLRAAQVIVSSGKPEENGLEE
jgi:molecular chaperone GrpE